MRRELFSQVSRLVIKLGTGVLTDCQRRLDLAQIEQLADQMAAQHRLGRELVLVSSGAIGAGMGVLGYKKRPTSLAELQACAAVGQPRLMALYEQCFVRSKLPVAQVLLTHEDLRHHERHLNARNTLVTLLDQGVIPIINENDAVSFTEIKLGDNDRLSALVACLLPADLLIILTTVEGLIENYGRPNARLLHAIDEIAAPLEKSARDTRSATAVGGMKSKLHAGKITRRAGIPLVIASGRKPDVLGRILAGESEGTIFLPGPKKLKGRKRWIAFFHHPQGSLIVDDGAKKALRDTGKSLLFPGIVRCKGEFSSGDVVCLLDLNGTEFARGITRFSSTELKGRPASRREVIHRDNLVIL